MSETVTLHINGRTHTLTLNPNTPLLWVRHRWWHCR